MSFSKIKQQSIRAYILEKVATSTPDLSTHVAETFEINRNTAHKYIKQLVDEGVLTREKRGKYVLRRTEETYEISAPQSESLIFSEYFAPWIKDQASNVRLIWEYAFTEMVNNVIDHSESDSVLIRVLQDTYRTRVLISDRGVGIFQKIKNHLALPTLEEAVFELFKGKLTTDQSRHSGEGIFFTSRLMDEFFIFSDQKIFAHNKYDESSLIDDFPSGCGTVVYMSLANNSQKQISQVFDKYSNVDGGFSKTSVLLKHVFESPPVSRSQAKRVCNRLENFAEVTLDFDGIEWMGQGFAHQIFVLFASEHPEVELLTTNMNDAVLQMYRHVTAN